MAYITLSYRDFGPKLQELADKMEWVLAECLGHLVLLYLNAQKAETDRGTLDEIGVWADVEYDNRELFVQSACRTGHLFQGSGCFVIEDMHRQLKHLERSRKANQWKPKSKGDAPPAGGTSDGQAIGSELKSLTVDDLIEAKKLLDASHVLVTEIPEMDRKLKRRKKSPPTQSEIDHIDPAPEIHVNEKASPTETTLELESDVPIRKKKASRPSKNASVEELRARIPGTFIWTSYRDAYVRRYGVEPLRNARVNSQLSTLAKNVGLEDGEKLVEYYLSRSDAFYVNAKHPIDICLTQAQKLVVEMKTGRGMNMTQAKKLEAKDATDAALRDYISELED